MLKGSGSLESEFRRLADSLSSNLGKIYESILNIALAKRLGKNKGLKVEKKPSSKELGVKAERKSTKNLGLRVENKGKPKVIERGANEVGVIPRVSPTDIAKESSLPKLLYEYSKDTGKSRIMLSPEESQAVLKLTDKSTKEGDVIKNGADLKISDSNNRTLFETDSKGVVIYSQNQRNPSVLKENGLGSAMDSLRGDLSNVISKAEARKPLGKGVEELNQSAMSLDEEVLAKTKSRAVPVERDQDIPRTETARTKVDPLGILPPLRKEIERTKAPTRDIEAEENLSVPPFYRPPTELSDREKVSLLNNLDLEPGSSVEMKGGSLSVEQHEGTLVVFFSDGERTGEQIASVEHGVTKISPQFSGQVVSIMREHIAELPHEVEKDPPAVAAPEEMEEEYDYEY